MNQISNNVTFVSDADKYKKEWWRKEDSVGSFDLKQWRNSTGFLYELDTFDTEFYYHIKLKKGEILFRYETDQTKISGMRIIVKINVERGLVYFLHDLYADDDKNLVFDTLGIKAMYLSLHNSIYNKLINN